MTTVTGNAIKLALIDYDLVMQVKVSTIHFTKPIFLKSYIRGFCAPEDLIPNASADSRKSDIWIAGATAYNLLTETGTLGYDYDKKRTQWMSYVTAANLNAIAPQLETGVIKPIPPQSYSMFSKYIAPNSAQGKVFADVLLRMDLMLTHNPKSRPNSQEMLTGKIRFDDKVVIIAATLNWARCVSKI
jgi:serine/threonine protein kinase